MPPTSFFSSSCLFCRQKSCGTHPGRPRSYLGVVLSGGQPDLGGAALHVPVPSAPQFPGPVQDLRVGRGLRRAPTVPRLVAGLLHRMAST